jgi:hypothetical protein
MLTKIRQNLSIFTLAISTCGTNWCAAQPRYVEMTDTVFQVGDLTRHDFFPGYVLRPYHMKFPDDNCINTTEEIYLFFLDLVNFIQSQPKLIFE